ncbi:MAG: PspC domain-containing protein [Muribaculaceae bacterium]|nr:PspC domain-containing protein [Muribaculaceae bacterium]
MKRNITVNIFGSLYPMDEDAYAMLNAYIVNMRDYFSRQPDGKEIADDIEGRVAELMSELRQNGTEAISIEHIEEIINRVGKPEQFVEEDDETVVKDIPPIPSSAPKKKLFRDPEHKVLGGVFSGLGCYLGVNPLWLRLTYIIIIFWLSLIMNITLPIILLLICSYIVCWGSIPLAANPAERLQMKGEPVNLSNMCDEFLTSTKEMISRQSEFNKDGRLTAGVVSVLKWCVYAIGILVITACIAGFIGILISIIFAISAPWGNLQGIVREDFLPLIIITESNPTWLIWVSSISIIVLLVISLYLLAHFTLRILGRVRPLSNTLRGVSLVLWLIALVFCAVSITKVVYNINYHYIPKHRVKMEKSRQETIAEKKEKQASQLEEAGWIIIKENNIQNYTNKGEHFSGDRGLTYIDAGMEHDGFGMEFEVERSQKVAPGTYRLESKGRANGNGAEIFAVTGNGTRYSEPIPVCGNKGGGIWKNAEIALKNDTAKILPNRHYLDKLTKVNHSQGYGWSDVTIDNITVGQDSIIRFGVTNVSPSHTWDGTWLSATSFELVKK